MAVRASVRCLRSAVLLLALLCLVHFAHGQTSISNYVTVGGFRFATLDNALPTDGTIGCQSAPLRLPAGWKLATSGQNAMLAIMSYQWATTCVVLGDGTSWYTRSGATCGSAQLAGTATTGYASVNCDRRVLITQAANSADKDFTAAVTITNFVVLNRTAYATLDNVDPTSTELGCQSVLKKLPTGWTLAADNVWSRALLLGHMYSFGTACLITASGASYSVGASAACGTDVLLSYSNLYYGARWCDRRVLIQRPAKSTEPDSWSVDVPITQFAVSQGLAYAVMGNVEPSSTLIGCQNRALRLPAGWTIAAPGPATTAIAAANYFGTNCLVLSDGTSIAHDGSACGGGVNQLLSNAGFYAVNWCDMRVLIQATASASLMTRLAVPRVLGMKVLILSATGDPSAEGQLAVAQLALYSMGIPYDTYAALPAAGAPAGTLTGPLVLRAGTALGLYSSFVATTSNVISSGAADALSPDNVLLLNTYMRDFGARLVSLYAFPLGRGVALSPATLSGNADPRTIAVAPGFAVTSLGLPATFSTDFAGVWNYAAVITDSSIASAALNYVSGTGAVQGVAAAVLNGMDGRTELQFYFDQALASLWVPWVTRGVFLGSRRIVLQPQVDDVLLSTEVFDTRMPGNIGAPVRCTDTDIDFHVAFQQSVNQLIPGSSFKLELPFNGAGTVEAGGPTADKLYQKLKQTVNSFFFESYGSAGRAGTVEHTFTHLDLTSNTETGMFTYEVGPLHNTTYLETLYELGNNTVFGDTWLGNNANWERAAMVTPRITGLFNPEALRAMWDSGIRYVVGDNTRPELVPANPYYLLNTTVEKNGFAGILIVPRFATEVYFNAATQQQLEDEYNFIYQNYFGYNSTLDQIMTREALRVVRYLLQFRHDPHMFHQANLVVGTFWDPVTRNNQKHSLLSLWTRYVLKELRRYINLPVLGASHTDLARMMLERMARDACGLSGSLSVDATGKLTAVTVNSSGSCRAGVTGIQTSATGVTTETYGTDTTVWVNRKAGTAGTKLTLKTPMDFTN